MVQQEVGYRISDSPSDNPTIKKSDNPLPVRALLYIIPTPTDFSNAILMDFINDRVEFLLEVMVFSHWAKKKKKKNGVILIQ